MSKKMEKKSAKKQQSEATLVLATYSEKAYVIFGNTKEVKGQLKELKLRYNPKLKCGAGWIGSMRKVDAAKAMFNLELVTMTEAELLAVGEKRKAEAEKAKAESEK